MSKKNMIFSIFWIVLGASLFIVSIMGRIDDIWSSMGIAFLVVGILQFIRQIRYCTDKTYKDKMDIANHDERNRFLANKAWAWAGYCYVMIGGVAVIVLLIMGRAEAQIVSFGVCLMLALYWVSYLILSRKY